MKNKLIALGLIPVFISAMVVLPQSAEAAVSITAASATLFDTSAGRFIYSKTPNLKRAPASTTKVLTAMVVLDNLSLDHVVTIPSFAESIQPSKAYLKTGERYYVRDLLKATLVSSANDAAEVLAVAAGGSASGFAAKMNQKVRQIGATNSHFLRASGLPAKSQYSTARDLALIMSHSQNYPFIASTLKQKGMVIQSLGGRKIYLRNHNKMLWRDSRQVIGKTGWTRNARHCFIGQMHLPSKKVVVSILGSHSLWRDLKKLMDYQFGSSISKVQTNRRLWSREETRRIQTALRNAGFNPGSVDGVFGSRTLRAVQHFQRSNGLSADGIVGSITWKKLEPYL